MQERRHHCDTEGLASDQTLAIAFASISALRGWLTGESAGPQQREGGVAGMSGGDGGKDPEAPELRGTDQGLGHLGSGLAAPLLRGHCHCGAIAPSIPPFRACPSLELLRMG